MLEEITNPFTPEVLSGLLPCIRMIPFPSKWDIRQNRLQNVNSVVIKKKQKKKKKN